MQAARIKSIRLRRIQVQYHPICKNRPVKWEIETSTVQVQESIYSRLAGGPQRYPGYFISKDHVSFRSGF